MGMDLREIVTASQEGLTAKRVFGEPVAQEGTVVIPVARVRGGGGGGEGVGPQEAGKPSGSGGGFGLAANPAGVYVIRNGKVRWMPALDVNRILLGFQLIAIIGIIFGTRAAAKLGREPVPRWWRRR